MNNKNAVRLESNFLYELLNEGGFGLVATFAELKIKRNSPEKFIAFKYKSNHKTCGGYRLLHTCTKLSINTLKKHVPTLVKMGLVKFYENGDVYIAGNNKTNRKKKNQLNKKVVPIIIGNSYTQTKSNVEFVLIHSNERKQRVEIVNKERQSEAIIACSSKYGSPTKNQIKLVKKLNCEGIMTVGDLKLSKFTSISNSRIGELCTSYSGVRVKDTKSYGFRKKRKFRENGFMTTRRVYKALESFYVDRTTYLKNRDQYTEKHGENIHWVKGRICKEMENEILGLISHPSNPVFSPQYSPKPRLITIPKKQKTFNSLKNT